MTGEEGVHGRRKVFFLTQRDRLIELAAHHAIPTIYAYREYVTAGGLMSYGGNLKEDDQTNPHQHWHWYFDAERLRGLQGRNIHIDQRYAPAGARSSYCAMDACGG